MRSGQPTAAETSPVRPARSRETAPPWRRTRPRSSRTSTATGRLGFPLFSGSSRNSSVSVSRSISAKVTSNNTFVFEPHSGEGEAANAGGAPMTEHPAWVTGHSPADFFHDAQTSQWQALFHSITGGHDTITAPENHDGPAATHFHLTDPHPTTSLLVRAGVSQAGRLLLHLLRTAKPNPVCPNLLPE